VTWAIREKIYSQRRACRALGHATRNLPLCGQSWVLAMMSFRKATARVWRPSGGGFGYRAGLGSDAGTPGHQANRKKLDRLYKRNGLTVAQAAVAATGLLARGTDGDPA